MNTPKIPCSSCAFTDCEAWVANPGMAHAILACLKSPKKHQFFCHDGYPAQIRPDGSKGSYQIPLLPDGLPDTSKLERCGGFLRWGAQYRHAAYVLQYKAVMALQLQMCRRFLKGTYDYVTEFRRMSRNSPKVLQGALNLQSLMAASDDD